MAAHAFWKGFLRISLVSIPVKAYSAINSGERISLNQLHADCLSRIQYKKSCPVHGEVPSAEIVSGYEVSKGRWVVIDPDELDRLRTDSDRNVSVDTFVPAGAVDPIHYSGRSYYLVPDAAVGQKPYQIIVDAMRDQKVEALAQVVIGRREQLVVVRAADGLLMMSSLMYAAEVRPASEFRNEVEGASANRQELQLAKQLISAMTAKSAKLDAYRDLYNEKLTALIQSKADGKELSVPEESAAPPVINLIDAMRASMKQVKSPPGRAAKPAAGRKKTGALRQVVAATRKTPAKKRKSG
ncbi:MAG: Ku protein [Planctomyces sp.]|nr:Ku protein [Planctomyces sp.]